MDLNLNFNVPSGTSTEYDVIIIGGGPAGTTAAIYTARADLRTLVIDKGLTAGALGITSKIVNYPGILGEISGAELLQRMREQAENFGATFIHERVQGVNLYGEMKTIITNEVDFKAPAIIIATGSMGRGQRVPGEDRLLGWGVSYCATCDADFFRDQTVAVVGISDEAISEALFLTKFVKSVEFFCPTPQLKAPLEMVEEIMAHPAVNVHLGTTLKEVVGDQKVEGVRVGQRGAAEQIVPVNGVFIYLQGAKPITDFVQGQIEISDAGCLLVDREFQTHIPGVYAIGDVLCDHVKQAVVAAAEGAVAAMAVEKHLHGRKQLAVDWSK